MHSILRINIGLRLLLFGLFSGAMFLIRELVMHIFFQNFLYLIVWGVPILRATVNVLAISILGATFIPESRVVISLK